jgi:hypothetical protein
MEPRVLIATPLKNPFKHINHELLSTKLVPKSRNLSILLIKFILVLSPNSSSLLPKLSSMNFPLLSKLPLELFNHFPMSFLQISYNIPIHKNRLHQPLALLFLLLPVRTHQVLDPLLLFITTSDENFSPRAFLVVEMGFQQIAETGEFADSVIVVVGAG